MRLNSVFRIVDAIVFRRSVSLRVSEYRFLTDRQRHIKVDQADITVRSDHYVAGFDVTVDIPAGRIAVNRTVKILKGLKKLDRPFCDLSCPKLLTVFHELLEALTLYVLHYGVCHIVFDKIVIDHRNIRVLQSFEYVHFSAELHLTDLFLNLFRFQNYFCIQVLVARKIYGSQAAGTYFLDHFISGNR